MLVPCAGADCPSLHLPLPACPPADGQRVAFLLFIWIVLGWLMPTLLLLPEYGGTGEQPGSGLFEAWLRLLKPSSRRRRGEAGPTGGQDGLSAAACALHWWVVLLLGWGLSCSVSGMLVPPAPAAAS